MLACALCEGYTFNLPQRIPQFSVNTYTGNVYLFSYLSADYEVILHISDDEVWKNSLIVG
jgi:hypothetical protein